ncbi:MAG: hypothetical protein L6R42_000754 [Xanthoria sp. 1 TBL-2021]|nr:MAG: hypothetical protein L6R42_000754 [Xanthoria sp. 1 TBL-2021]
MRLINTTSCDIREFIPGKIPSYAILSHTWGDDEYIFSDRDIPHRRDSAGFKKISGCCSLALSQGYDYLWVDTCCIDKTSSAELTESINSMYKWYEHSHICYVYLSDYSLEEARHGRGKSFRHSRWFTRGWTLQELLAPDDVVFFDAAWMEIGSKTFLHTYLTDICRISTRHLSHPKEASVAAKMSWASKRETTREEDVAYSLLGIFGVNMPLLYGEGKNAFFRLQCEIIQSSSDESIFAWKDARLDHPTFYSGLLAAGPLCFEGSGDIVPIRLKHHDRPPYSLTNQGLSIELSPYGHDGHDGHECKPDENDPKFASDLRYNGDQRLGEINAVNGFRFKSVIACARDSTIHAPVMLKFRIVTGRLASRVNCSVIEFDERNTDRAMRSRKNATQTYFIGHQTFSKDTPSQNWIQYSTRVALTSTFRQYFALDEHGSRGFELSADGSTVSSWQEAHGIFDHGADGWVRLQFKSAREYILTLSWNEKEILYEDFLPTHGACYIVSLCGFRDSDYTLLPRSLRLHPIPFASDKTLKANDNLVAPMGDKVFLSISARQTGDQSNRRRVVRLNVASISLLGALEYAG